MRLPWGSSPSPSLSCSSQWTRRQALTAAWLGAALVPAPSHALQVGLQIKFVADVTRETCLELQTAVEERVAQRASILHHLEHAIAADVDVPPLPIHLHVSSNGGSLLSALHVYDVLRGVPNLHTHVEGLVASAATLFTVVGSHRTMTRHSMMLVHQPSTHVDGDWKYTDLRDEHVNMQKCTQALLHVYNETTTMDYSDLVTLLQNEQMLTATECLEYGFIDEIV